MDQQVNILQIIEEFLRESELNKVPELRLPRIFEDPVIGIADAEDPLFLKLKEPGVISPAHLTPAEWLSGAKTVISYFLPFSQKVREANYSDGLPALEWVYGRWEGEMCNNQVRRLLVDELEKSGQKAIAPALDSGFRVVERKSNWSERHAAYIAGLGTFGHGRSLITLKGCAGRFGSVITTLKIEPTIRRHDLFHTYCESCLSCVDRCASGAIRPEGKNIPVCSDYQDNIIKPKFDPRHGCGKCQTALPCEDRIPS